MESKTKVRLSNGDIKKLVNYAFGNKSILSVAEMTDGWFNTAYHITLEDKTQTVLKVGPPADAEILTYEKDLLRAEVETMKLVATEFRDPCASHYQCRFFLYPIALSILFHGLRQWYDLEQSS